MLLEMSSVGGLQFADGLQDPRVQIGDIGIDAGVVGVSAPVAPGHDTHQLAAGDQRAAGVALAGVLAGVIGAQHGQLDLGAVAIDGGGARRASDNADIHLHQMSGEMGRAVEGGSPAGYHRGRSIRWCFSGQTDRLHRRPHL